jgi:clan AA aspartic protease
MIEGTISNQHEAIIRLSIHGPDGQLAEIDAIIDTGFNDCLTLPPSLLETLDLPFEAPTLATLADGSTVTLDFHRATIQWDNQRREVLVLAAEGGALVGVGLLKGFHLAIDFVVGGKVTIEPIKD